jgi:hypothetical protein
MAKDKEIKVVEIGIKEFFVVFLLLLMVVFSILFLQDYFKPKLNLRVETRELKNGVSVSITGKVTIGYDVLTKYVGIEVRDPENNLVWIDALASGKNGFNSTFLVTDIKYGEYVVYATTDLVSEKVKFRLKG